MTNGTKGRKGTNWPNSFGPLGTKWDERSKDLVPFVPGPDLTSMSP